MFAQVVWLEPLQEAATRVTNAVRETSTTDIDGIVINCEYIKEAKVTGIARHPLAISVGKNTIQLLLSEVDPTTPIVDGDYSSTPPASLKDAILRARDAPEPSSFVRRRVHRTRAIAYNAERLTMACSLACSLQFLWSRFSSYES